MNEINRKWLLIVLFGIGTFFIGLAVLIANGRVGESEISSPLFYTSIVTVISGIPFLSFRFKMFHKALKFLDVESYQVKYGSFIIGLICALLVYLDDVFSLGIIYESLKDFSDSGGMWALSIMVLILSLLLMELDGQLNEKRKSLEGTEQIEKMQEYIEELEKTLEEKK